MLLNVGGTFNSEGDITFYNDNYVLDFSTGAKSDWLRLTDTFSSDSIPNPTSNIFNSYYLQKHVVELYFENKKTLPFYYDKEKSAIVFAPSSKTGSGVSARSKNKH